jgi:glutamyl-tRNA reductase
MQIAVVGLNFRSAPVAVRERVALEADRLEAFYRAVGETPELTGAVALSTCNRTEIYWAGLADTDRVVALWAEAAGVGPERFEEYLYWHRSQAAARHLFRVATGLDSMVLGETQILGQVKTAYQAAQRAGAAGGLHRLFLRALRVGKRAHAETGISQNALSVGYAAVELARKIFGEELARQRALVVGTGENGALVARHLRAAGVARMTVVNRTLARAEALARDLGADVVPFERLGEALAGSDVVVTSTGAPAAIVTREMVRAAVKGRRGAPLVLLDLAVPRDVAPGVEEVAPFVFRYDVDDLEAVVQHNRVRREREVQAVERIIEEEVAALTQEMDVSAVAPLIRSLREKAERLRQQELEYTFRRLPHLSERDRAVVDQAMRHLLNQLLNDPMVSIRGWAGRPEGAVYLAALRDLFRLKDLQEEDGPLPSEDT